MGYTRTTVLCLAMSGYLLAGPAETPGRIVALSMKEPYCGPNCLSVFLMMQGQRVKVSELAELAGTTAEGTTMLGLKQAAEAKGLQVEGIKVNSLADLRALQYPAIVSCRTAVGAGFDHYVLVLGFDGDRVKIVDVPSVPFTLPINEFESRFSGRVLLLSTQAIVLPRQQGSSRNVAMTVGVLGVLATGFWLVRRRLGCRQAHP